MGVTTIEGIVEDGKIRISPSVRLPENAKVYIVVPDGGVSIAATIRSPRFAHPEDAVRFTKEVIEDSHDAALRQ